MKKSDYVIKSSNGTLKTQDTIILMHINKNNFIKQVDIPDVTQESIDRLMQEGYIEKSGDGLIVSGEGVDLIINAATDWANETNPDLTAVKITRTKRGVTDSMQAFADKTEQLINGLGIKVKDVIEDRSNLLVRFVRTKTVKQFDIRRDGNLRVHAYNADPQVVKEFNQAGFSVKIGGKNTYLDITLTEENILKAIEILRG